MRARPISLLCLAFCLLLPPIPAASDWEDRGQGLTSLFIVDVAIDPSNPDTLYAQTRFDGLWKSTDGAASWVYSSTGLLPSGPPYGHLVNDAVVIDSSDSQNLLAVTAPSLSNFGRIYRSTNGGASWSFSSTGASISGLYGIVGVVQDPSDPLHYYAGTIVTGFDGGLFESTDGGQTWTNIAGSVIAGDGDLGNDCWPIRIDPDNSQRMFCGSPHDSFLYSLDGGQTWTESNPAGNGADKSVYVIAVNPLDTDEIWIDHTDGNYRSVDGGLNWTDVTATFGGENLIDLRFAPSNPNIAYALAGPGLYKTTNNGTTWNLIAPDNFFAQAITIHPTDPDTLYLGTWGRGVLKSTDGGANLTPVNNNLPVTNTIDIDSITGDPVQPGRVFCHLRGNGLYRSDDYGQSWTFLDPMQSYYLDGYEILPWNPNVHLGTWYDLYRSSDAGNNWSTAQPATGSKRYRGLALEPARERIWLVQSPYSDPGAEVLYSDDDGASWEALPPPGSPPNDQLNAVAADPFQSDVLLAGCSPKYSTWMQYGWIHRSEDGGQSWTRIKSGLELRDWNLLAGQWTVNNNVLYQGALNDCNVAFTARPVLVRDATFTMRTRITQVADGDTLHWSGLSVGLPDINSPWSDGVLVGMRANGEAFLWSDGITRISVLNAVSNTSQFQTIGVYVQGDAYTLLLNNTELGTWTDSGNQWDAGYFTLATCKARAYFDNVTVRGGANFSDDFNIGNWKQGNNVSQVMFSQVQPGVAYANTRNAIFRSSDHGQTWSRMTSSADENLYMYDLYLSRFGSGNLYLTKGSFSPANFVTGVFPNGTGSFQALGSPSTFYYRNSLSEDATSPNLLYGAQYGPGPQVFQGLIPGTSGVPRTFWHVR